MEFVSIKTVGTTRAAGKTTSARARVMNGLATEMCTLGTIKTEKSAVKEFTSGTVAILMMGSGRRDRSTVTVFGKTLKEIVTLVSGLAIWRTATECTSGKTEIVTRESGIVHSGTGKARTYLLTATFSWASTPTEKQKATASTDGQMEILTAGCSRTAENRARELGKSQARI